MELEEEADEVGINGTADLLKCAGGDMSSLSLSPTDKR